MVEPEGTMQDPKKSVDSAEILGKSFARLRNRPRALSGRANRDASDSLANKSQECGFCGILEKRLAQVKHTLSDVRKIQTVQSSSNL